jgi:dihydroorotase
MGADAAAAIDLPGPSLKDGSVADVALIDLDATTMVGESGFQSKSTNSAFLGEELFGVVELTIAGGQVAWRK